MKLLLLTNLHSPHSIKWVRGLAQLGHELMVCSLSPFDASDYSDLDNVTTWSAGFSDSLVKTESGRLGKLRYFRILSSLVRIHREFKPDLVHAHRVSSYGLLGRILRAQPYIISVWGDDIYLFPEQSWLKRQLVEFALRGADYVLSTSKVMAYQTQKYTDKPVHVTPFGIDLERFASDETQQHPHFDEDDTVIGTIKTMEEKYGIRYLIEAFAEVVAARPAQKLKLLLIGTGSQLETYKNLAIRLGIADKVRFEGRVPFTEVPRYHNMIDIFAALSTLDSESFGVAIIEASASGKPVVVSNVGGPAEVVVDGKTGYVVTPRDSHAAAQALLRLVDDESLRKQLGTNGRAHVMQHYRWEDNLQTMVSIYQHAIQRAPQYAPAVVAPRS